MSTCSCVEVTEVTSKPGKEKGIECNEKLLMKTCVLSAVLYEPEAQWLSTPSAGEPLYQALDSPPYEIIQNQEHEATIAIIQAFKSVLPSDCYLDSLTSRVEFADFNSDWREKFLDIIQGKVALNQCKPIQDKPRYTWEYLFFRSTYEIAIAKALSEYKVLFLPNCMAHFAQEGQNREADFLVCCDGKWGIIEVDGESYHTNAARDHDRDRLFQSHGIRVVQHYTAKRCTENPRGVVQEFLGLLKKNG